MNRPIKVQKNGMTITIDEEIVNTTWNFQQGGKGSGSRRCFQNKEQAEESRAFFMSKEMYDGSVKITTTSDGKKHYYGVSKVRFGKRRKSSGYGHQKRHQESSAGYWTESAIGDKAYGLNVLIFLHIIANEDLSHKCMV
jgi:hypothetical protein